MDLSHWNVGLARTLPDSIAHAFLANGNFREVAPPPKANPKEPEPSAEEKTSSKKKP
jgi:hypothetical protein